MRFLPVFLDLSAGPVVLVGSGAQAIAKLHLLRAAGANVRWFSPEADVAEELLLAKHYAGHIGITIGEPGRRDLTGALAVVSSARSEIDERVASLARSAGVPVNVVDRPDLSTFIFPAIVDRGDVVVAIGPAALAGAGATAARTDRGDSSGADRRVRRADEPLSRTVAEVRRRVPALSLRRFWERVIDGPIGAAFLAGRTREAEAALARAIDDPIAAIEDRQGHGASGRRRSRRSRSADAARAACPAGRRRDLLRRVGRDRRFSTARGAMPSGCSSASARPRPASARTRSTGD